MSTKKHRIRGSSLTQLHIYADELKVTRGITKSSARDVAAIEYGYKSYSRFRKLFFKKYPREANLDTVTIDKYAIVSKFSKFIPK